VLAKNYHGGPGPAQVSLCSTLKKVLIPEKISFYPNWAGLYALSLEGVNLPGTDKSSCERSGGGVFWGLSILGLYSDHGELGYIYNISKDKLRGLRAYEAQELN
jgi:hypothetical protein